MKLPNTSLEPLYREDAHGLELSYDVLAAFDYIEWVLRINYVHPDAVAC